MKPLYLYLHMVLLFFQNFTNELWDFLSNFTFGHIWQWKVEATWTRLVFNVSSTYLFPVVWFVGNLFQCWTSPTLVFSVKTYGHLLTIWYNLKQKDDKHISSRRRISGRRLSDDRKYVCVRRLTHQELALATCNYWALSKHQEYTKQERNFFNLICKHWQLTYQTRGIVFHRILNTEATSTRIRIFLKTEIVFLRFNLTFKRKWIILGETQSKC